MVSILQTRILKYTSMLEQKDQVYLDLFFTIVGYYYPTLEIVGVSNEYISS